MTFGRSGSLRTRRSRARCDATNFLYPSYRMNALDKVNPEEQDMVLWLDVP